MFVFALFILVCMKIIEAVSRVIDKYPYLREYLSLGLINYNATARFIREEVRNEVKRDVKIQSIVTALRRLSSREKSISNKVIEILAYSEVGIKYDFAALYLKPEEDVDLRDGILIKGTETLTVIAEERKIKVLKVNKKFRRNLACIIVKSPESIIETPGVIAYLASILALNRINIVEMMSSATETLFILDEKDSLRAVEIIRNEIKRARRRLNEYHEYS